MVKTWVAVLVADLVMVTAALLILQDVNMRLDCSIPGCTSFLSRTSAAFTYSVLTKSFSVVVNGSTLASPPILDWFQVLALALVALNGWYGYRVIFQRSRTATI